MKPQNLNVLRTILAMLPPVVAFILQWTFWSVVQPFVWFLFYPAVFLSAWIGGLVTGLLSTLVSVVIVWWFFISPQFSFGLEKPISLVSIGVFSVMGVLFSITLDHMKKLIKQADEAQRASEQRLISALQWSHTGGWDLDLIDHTAYRTLEHDRIFGYESLLPQWTYEMFLEHVLPEDRIEVDRLFSEAITAQTNWSFECQIRRADGEVRWIWATGGHQRDVNGTLRRMAGIVQDITERKKSEMLLSGQKQVLEMIANGTSLPETLAALVRFIEAQAPGMLGSILLLDEDGVHVRHGAAPSMPEEFVAAVDGQPIGPCAGSCGTAAYRKEAVYVEDIATDPLWEAYKAVALPQGLHACWSTPIFDEQRRVLGTFAMYFRQPRLPQPEHLRLIDIATQTAVIAINQHRTEMALRDKEARIRNVFEQANDGIYIISAENRYLDANARGLELLGYTRDELLQMGVADVLTPHGLARLAVEPPQMMNGEPHLAEWEHVRKDGATFPGEVSARRLDDHSYLAIVRDLTERKRAEQEILKLNKELEQRVAERTAVLEHTLSTLRVSEENLSVTLNSIGDGVMATDAEGRVTRLNAVAERLTGWSQTAAAGRPVADVFYIINQETRLPATIPVMETLAHGTIQGLANHTVLIARDGSECAIADSCAPIRNRDGEVMGAVLVFRDVTQEYAAQVALHDSATRIQTILNTVAEGIISINERGMVETINPAGESLFGYAAAEIIGQNIKILMPEPYHSQHDGYLEHYLTTGEARIIGKSRDVLGRRKNGSTFPMYLAVNEMKLSGTLHFTGIVRDLTERQQYEQNLVVAKDDAEQANHAKDSFLATMSHEIRTPLTGMLGMLEVLSMTSLDHEQDTTLKAAWDSARSLLRIVNDILDWSKIQEGKLALSPQSTSIPLLLQEVVNTYSRVASAKSLMLWQHADSRIGAAHIVDPLRLSQVLNNFVSNAIKFTPHGEIELRAELLEQLDSGERIRFSVKDTGIGIAKDVQQNLFQRFHQESADTARMYGGTGLGLSICRRLAELLDGQVELISEPGQGATFCITVILPVSAAPGEKTPTLVPVVEQKKVKPLLDGNGDAPMVLAVDDHPINRDLLARQIKLLGLRAETAEDGHVALSMWRDGHFALVITDCHMPEMDGYTLTRAIRKIEAEEKLPRTPIIAWTANALAEEGKLCQDAGMDDLLVKPADLTQLKKMLAKWLSIPETDSSQTTPSLHDADGGQATGPIDYAELSKVVPDCDEQIQVLHNFQSHIRADRTKLLEMLEQGDEVNVERTAHRMKGSSLMVGAKDLASACIAIEQAAREGDMDGTRVGTTSLDDAFRRFETHVAELTDSKGDNK